MAKKEQEQTTDMIPVVAETKDIKSLIYVVRGQQVMLDSDLAMLYHVGASIKDAGKKCFGISLIDDPGVVEDLLNRLKTV